MNMKLTTKSFAWGLGAAMTLTLGTYIYAMNISWKNFGANLVPDVAASDPAWMIVIGLSLFGVRALIARPDDAPKS